MGALVVVELEVPVQPVIGLIQGVIAVGVHLLINLTGRLRNTLICGGFSLAYDLGNPLR